MVAGFLSFQRGSVDLLDQILVAGAHGILQLEIDHVPGAVVGLDLGAQLGQAAIVVGGQDLAAIARHVGLEERLGLAGRVGAAERGDDELLFRRRSHRPERGGSGEGGDDGISGCCPAHCCSPSGLAGLLRRRL
jgi:hypothetical protein